MAAGRYEIRVSDYGLHEGGEYDCIEPIRRALMQCQGHPGARVIFPKGKFHIHGSNEPNSSGLLFDVENCQDLEIVGDGTELIGHGFTSSFRFSECHGLHVSGLTLDWEPVEFCHGRVVQEYNGMVDFEILPPHRVDDFSFIKGILEYDPIRRAFAHRAYEWTNYRQGIAATVVGPNRLRVDMTGIDINGTTLQQPGTHFLLRQQVYGGNAFDVSRSSNVTFENMMFYSTPGFAFHAGDCHDIRLKNLSVRIRPGTGRIMSITSDATHFSCCNGTIQIENCDFEGMGDDAINIHGVYLRVTQKVNERTVIATGNGRAPGKVPSAGDVIELTSGETMLPYDNAVIKHAERSGTMDVRIEFTDPLPAALQINDMLGNLSHISTVRVNHCSVRNNRARGFLIQTRDAIIEENTFQSCTGAGIHVTCDNYYWYESIGCRDVVVRHNSFIDCNRGVGMQEGAINVYAHCPNGLREYSTRAPFGGVGVHQRITIEENYIRGTDNAAIHVASTDGVTIRGNLIDRPCENPNFAEGEGVIYLQNTNNAAIENNTLVPDNRPLKGIVVGKGCDSETFSIGMNNGLSFPKLNTVTS
ncbi:MAG TPA: right-handed parallel beta-helix repeat-containing protein [Armatimonadota bacterium]|nr:right-handed parallel beta-helix repeat-containing protein [Armatimonadota bacterium]